MRGRQDLADIECPERVLVTGRCRVGGQQGNNLYIVDDDETEYYVGALFRASYGDPMASRFNLGRIFVPVPSGYVQCVVNVPKQCVRPLSHGGWHISNSGTTWPSS